MRANSVLKSLSGLKGFRVMSIEILEVFAELGLTLYHLTSYP